MESPSSSSRMTRGGTPISWGSNVGGGGGGSGTRGSATTTLGMTMRSMTTTTLKTLGSMIYTHGSRSSFSEGIPTSGAVTGVADTQSVNTQFFRYLLNNTHPAQVQGVNSACKVIASETGELIFDDLWTSLMRDYNESKCVAVSLLDGSELGLICPEGRVSNTVYFHPRLGKCFSVDHELQEGVIDGNSDLAPNVLSPEQGRGQHSQHRLFLERAVELHAKRFYPSESRISAATSKASPPIGTSCAVYGEESLSGLQTITVVIRSLRFSAKNAWAGLWLSRWKVSFTPGQSDETLLKGCVLADVQYLEDGNTRFRQSKEFSRSIPPGGLLEEDPKGFAGEVTSRIAECETTLLTALEGLFVFIDGEMLRGVRRIVPVSCKRCNWDPVTDMIRTELSTRAATAAQEIRAKDSPPTPNSQKDD